MENKVCDVNDVVNGCKADGAQPVLKPGRRLTNGNATDRQSGVSRTRFRILYDNRDRQAIVIGFESVDRGPFDQPVFAYTNLQSIQLPGLHLVLVSSSIH